MAKETKQDRVVRSIFDQVSEHLHEIKSIEANVTSREIDVERWAQSFLKSCLGFTPSAGYAIRAQETKGKMRPDLIIHHNDKPVFVVEVKKIGFELSKSDFRSGKTQLSEYLNHLGNVRWGILTNGIEWRLYDFSQTQYGGFEIAGFDLKSGGEAFDMSKRALEEQCYDLLDIHESSYTAESWADLSKEAFAFSPESLSRAILSSDVVKYIARSIRGEHEYKANHEILTDKLFQLLEEGLNDAIPGWNEAKHVEFHKYIKSQKRASRKARKPRKETSKDQTAEAITPSPIEGVATEEQTIDVTKSGAA